MGRDLARWRRKLTDYSRSMWVLLTGIAPPVLVARLFLRLAGTGVHEIRLRDSGTRLLVRGPMDVWAVKEAFLDRLYERHGFPVLAGWVVIDIGAGIGEFSLFAAWQGASVTAFEPFPGSFVLLRENVRRNAADVRVFDCAIAGASGALDLDVGLSDPVYFRSRTLGDDAGTPVIEVRALSLADALERCGIDHVDLLKLDCEGAEYDILGAEPEVLARVDRIVMEYHEWNGHTHGELVELLERAGYAVQAVPNRTYPSIGYLRAARSCHH